MPFHCFQRDYNVPPTKAVAAKTEHFFCGQRKATLEREGGTACTRGAFMPSVYVTIVLTRAPVPSPKCILY